MYLHNLLILFLLHHLTVSAKHRHHHRSFSPASTTTIMVTETITETAGPMSTALSNTNSTASSSFPAGPYTVIAFRSGSPFDQLNLTASGGNFTLGGVPSGSAIYCPKSTDHCPSGNVTAFLGYGVMYAEVPGGQLVYVTKDGRLGYTQPHSASYPPGSVLAPFVFTTAVDNSSVAILSTYAFDAPGLMACLTSDGSYQVFAAISNATVPTGNISDCTGFVAIFSGYGGPPVWEYI